MLSIWSGGKGFEACFSNRINSSHIKRKYTFFILFYYYVHNPTFSPVRNMTKKISSGGKEIEFPFISMLIPPFLGKCFRRCRLSCDKKCQISAKKCTLNFMVG